MQQVRLIDAETGRTCVPNVKVASRFGSRLLGLMGRKSLPAGSGLVIEPCNGIHTCFMRFPIDVAYLDRDWQVIRVDQAVRPWRVGRPVRGSRRVIELPAGTADRQGITIGTRLRLEAVPSVRA